MSYRTQEVKRIAHLSDLHFGAIDDNNIVKALIDSIRSIQADLIVVSGDLTQRAKPKQFIQASIFCSSFEVPVLITPGNHDLEPWWHPYRRQVNSYKTFTKYFGYPEENLLKIGNCLIARVITNQPLAFQKGTFSTTQAKELIEKLGDNNCEELIIVTHHPLTLKYSESNKSCVIPEILVDWMCRHPRVTLLSGHTHIQEAQILRRRGENVCLRSIAGTATSYRWRGESGSGNQYAVLEFQNNGIVVETYSYSADRRSFNDNDRAFYNLSRVKG